MIAKNGVDWDKWGFSVMGECPEYIKKCKRPMDNGRNSYTKEYKTWGRILKTLKDNKDLDMCKEWENFEAFNEWYKGNYYEVEGEQMILSYRFPNPQNKIFSSNGCSYMPKNILNCLGLYYNSKESVLPQYIMKKVSAK